MIVGNACTIRYQELFYVINSLKSIYNMAEKELFHQTKMTLIQSLCDTKFDIAQEKSCIFRQKQLIRFLFKFRRSFDKFRQLWSL